MATAVEFAVIRRNNGGVEIIRSASVGSGDMRHTRAIYLDTEQELSALRDILDIVGNDTSRHSAWTCVS